MKILVIDDERSIRLSLEIGLKKLGLEVCSAESGEEGLELLEKENPDLAIVDIKLPGIDGIEVLKIIKKLRPSCIVIMITYMTDVKLAVEAMKIGAYDYFTKPFSLTDINDSIQKTLEYIEVKRKLDSFNKNHEAALIGNSPSIQKIRETIVEIGNLKYDTSILIQAESGTGKEVVARLIHKVKNNSKDSFMAINCAAIPKNLQESELFGYEKGAFSDAKTDKVGLIEKANRGILFLDEIGDMDIGLQAKMLRVLQEKKFRRIGGIDEISFKATIIAATNKNLLEEIKLGNFRQDLYYRLNIIPIHIPPLRERKEDILLLANSFVNEYNEKLNKNVVSINSSAMNILKEYSWPGNVRELKNLFERLMIFKKGDQITEEDLPDEIRMEDSYEERNYTLENIEEAAIKRSLEKNNWNITKTANELKISRQTLRKKIEKYEIK